MHGVVAQENAVAAIRISSLKQGLQGDSPEAQKEQIGRFAQARNIHIKKFFIFMESASKEEQPVQEAIDYCVNPSNDIQLFIIKSIDRFTRGGSYLYDHLKMQLQRQQVRLIDIYGIIGSQDVNTLEHLGLSYSWSVYSPTKKSEILEAERAKDEMRDIMSRMIGAEIRYVRLGYRVRQAPFGYLNEKVETTHGKRVILKPHPEEAPWIRKMFELRCLGTLSDQQITDEINKLGYRTRRSFFRDPNDRTKVIGERGGKPLHFRQLWRFIRNPIYAGINLEKWTQGELIKGHFAGLVSIEVFNQANHGKLSIVKEGDSYRFQKEPLPDWMTKKLVENPSFPYKRVIMCPHCNKPLFGSASRGKMGKYYPAYHCNKRGHYFRVPSKELESTVEEFVRNIKIDDTYVQDLKKYVLELWNQQIATTSGDVSLLDEKISQLRVTVKATMDKIKYLSSEVAINYLEADVIETTHQIEQLEREKQLKSVGGPPVDMVKVMDVIGYFLEHLEDLLIDTANPLKRASFFGLIFDGMPTYAELISGTPKLAPYLALKNHLDGGLVSNGDPTENRTLVTRMKT